MNLISRPASHISLEQWRSLVAVVEAGGYAQAAEALHKSQSAVSYAVQKIESQLGLRAFEQRIAALEGDADERARALLEQLRAYAASIAPDCSAV